MGSNRDSGGNATHDTAGADDVIIITRAGPGTGNTIRSVFDDVLAHRSHPEWDRLLFACHQNRPHEVERLLGEGGVDPSHANPVGHSALHVAAWWGHSEVVGLLLKHGARVNTANSLTGATPLHCCLQNMRPSSSSSYSGRRPGGGETGSVTVRKWIHDDDDCGGGGGDRTGTSGSVRLRRRLDCIRMLARAGADWQARDMNGKTPLEYYDADAMGGGGVAAFLASVRSTREGRA
jgi:hypothetical protein